MVVKEKMLARALAYEIERVRAIGQVYRALPEGFVFSGRLSDDIADAMSARRAGDREQMLDAYERLKEYDY